jgi:hypothetical protein
MTGARDGRRILVVGVAGSGKTTMALALGARLGVPAIHLDNVADADGQVDPSILHAPPGEFPDHPFVPRPLDERVRIAESIAVQPAWVAEGSFIEWTDPLQDAADTIVWLDQARARDSIASVLGRAMRSSGRAQGGPAGRSPGGGPSDSSGGSASPRVLLVRLAAIGRHGVGLVLELRDVVSYYWSRNPPGARRDAAAGRWDRVTRAQVAARLARHADRVIRIREASQIEGLVDWVAAGPSRSRTGETHGQAADPPPAAAR